MRQAARTDNNGPHKCNKGLRPLHRATLLSRRKAGRSKHDRNLCYLPEADSLFTTILEKSLGLILITSLPIYFSVLSVSVSLSISLSLSLPLAVCLSVWVPACLSLCVSVPLCLALCLSLFVCIPFAPKRLRVEEKEKSERDLKDRNGVQYSESWVNLRGSIETNTGDTARQTVHERNAVLILLQVGSACL